MQVSSFAPIVDERSRVLILGTMPGAESLAQQQYYAHARNAFWPIVIALSSSVGKRNNRSAEHLNYDQKLKILSQSNIALWDVLQQCERKGSLDANIRSDTEIVNNILGMIQEYPNLQSIGFNGRKARQCFDRCYKTFINGDQFLVDLGKTLALIDLPSTSPAYAALTVDGKVQRWSRALKPFINTSNTIDR